MIKLYNRLPEIYFTESRDFQALARAHEVLYNYLKTNADTMQSLSFDKNFDVRLLNLLATSQGFCVKHNYNTRDLFNLCSAFADILKNKGSLVSIEKTISLLLNAQQIESSFDIDIDVISGDKHELLIYLPKEIKDTVLLEDVFDYILPSGYTYSFILTDFAEGVPTLKLGMSEAQINESYASQKIGQVANYNSNTARFDYDTQPTDLSETSSSVIVDYDSNN